ncbi:DUF2243 domain-containing protein [Telluribacter sp.]|jgi:uncharacterized membrane protein|uniref:DUF2243 domain-containing protein n=1 Tax=Telluribacter sp. TaxID=1978767 RepID=UPI002E1148F7|nr:DUF2243 domain-containing protein [Telluribacter sp.]
MKRIGILTTFLLCSLRGLCCTTCDARVQEKIYDSTFLPNLVTMLSAFIVLALVVAGLAVLSTRRHTSFLAANPGGQYLNPVPLTTASTVLGIGIGGFIDGIFLHQILQWHEMLSNRMPPTTLVLKSVNMFWDGIFHAFTLIVVIIGIVLLWKLLHRRDIDRSGRLLVSGLILGWGLFNIIEGVIDHHLLKLHNVREITPNVDLWNYGFLGLSVGMVVVGYFMIHRTPDPVPDSTL